METRRNRNGSLPGDRQGMSGAGAGHDSRRTTGGRMLRRRAPTIGTTAQQHQQHQLAEEHEAGTSSATPSTSLSSGYRSRTAQEVIRKTRIKWSREMNTDIIIAYYRANKCEDRQLPGYRHLMYAEFTKIRPELQLNEQNVIDRMNAIVKRGYLTSVEIQNIRRQVGYEIHQLNLTNNQISEEENQSSDEQTDGRNNPDIQTQQKSEEIAKTFFSLMGFHRHTIPSNRPILPILKRTWKLKSEILIINDIISRHLNQIDDIEEIQLALYCAAETIINLNGQKVYHPATKTKKTINNEPAWQRRLKTSIDQFRSKADQIDEYLKGKRSKKIKKKIQYICSNAKINFDSTNINQILLELKDDFR
jgi:hypothetical protein